MASLPDSLAPAAHALAATPLATLFARDPARVERLCYTFEAIRVDLSKQRITPEALALLVAHAEAIGLPRWIAALLSGEKINLSEGRPALHTALRTASHAPLRVDGHDVIPDVHAVRARMHALADALRSGARKGATGAVRNIVSIGIGGSDLGPRLVCDALVDPRAPSPVPVHFVSNVDPDELERAIAPLDPTTTLAIVVSNTLTTQETHANAHSIRQLFAGSAAK